MRDDQKTRQHLIEELALARRRIAELEAGAQSGATRDGARLPVVPQFIQELIDAIPHELELRVAERTAELEKANEELQVEVAERKRAEGKLREKNEFLKHLIESLTHPFCVIDANDYTVQIANSAAAPEGLQPGATCYGLTHKHKEPCNGAEGVCPLQEVKRTGRPVTTEHIHFDEEGLPRSVEIHVYPIFDEEGNVIQIIEYAVDITERKLLERALRENAERIKLFAYSISHDLKSPLIGINGLARLLHKQYCDVLDERGRKYCDQIVKATGQVVTLVEEINAYIRAKELPANFEAIDTKEILRSIRAEFDLLLVTRQVEWLEPDDIPPIKADRMSLLRVFRNFIDNALKYGGNELAWIRIGYHQSDDSHVFSVSDDGAGIRNEDCEKIFELFHRRGGPEKVEGAGIGLAIIKEIAEKHRGRVWAEPGSPKGAMFFFAISKLL